MTRKQYSVNGQTFDVFSCFIKRSTFAVDTQTGEEKVIRGGGYLSNELSIRKAIASSFQLPTFRKERVQ
jgi:hypothetical protein